MDATLPDIDAAEAMLAKLAAMDFALAQHLHTCAMNTDDPADMVELSRAYQRIARSTRQSLALHARLKRDREREARENLPPPAPPPPTPRRDPHRIAERRDALRAPVQRVIWSEHEPLDADDPDEAGYYFDLLEERLALGVRDNTFGLTVEDGAWTVEAFDEHVVRVCRSLRLPEVAARAWRDLPDPPPEALRPEDPDEDADDGDPLARLDSA